MARSTTASEKPRSPFDQARQRSAVKRVTVNVLSVSKPTRYLSCTCGYSGTCSFHGTCHLILPHISAAACDMDRFLIVWCALGVLLSPGQGWHRRANAQKRYKSHPNGQPIKKLFVFAFSDDMKMRTRDTVLRPCNSAQLTTGTTETDSEGTAQSRDPY